jgi:hypothetical protein
LEEPIWGNGLDDTTWSSDIDDLLWNNTKNDDSNWEEVTEVAITESKDIRPTTAIEGPKSKSTKAIPSASTAAGTSKIYYSKSVPVVTSKPLSIIPSLYVANQEKPKAYTTPTPSSSWSVITKTSSLATMSKSIHISLSFIVESATAEDTISNKVNIRTPIPTSVDKEIAATPSVYSSSPDMPGGYPYEQSHSIGGMGYIGVFSDGGNGIHHSNSLNLLLLIFTLVLLFFHD